MARQFEQWNDRTTILLETAVPEELLASADRGDGRAGFVWVGRIAGHKGWRLALESYAAAFAMQPHAPRLRVVGSGPDEAAARKVAADLQISDKIDFEGFRSQADVWTAMRSAKGLLFSSVRDTSGNAALEAMALGCPVVCLNHQGLTTLTDDTCALRIDPGTWDQTVRGFALALRRLENEPELVQALGRAGRLRASRLFNWEHKLDVMDRIYASVRLDPGGQARTAANAPCASRVATP